MASESFKEEWRIEKERYAQEYEVSQMSKEDSVAKSQRLQKKLHEIQKYSKELLKLKQESESLSETEKQISV